jgi:DNA mismatch repair protein MutL
VATNAKGERFKSGPLPGSEDPGESPAASSAGASGEKRQDDLRTASLDGARPIPPALQVLDRYLVLEGEGGVVVIDQHALHERILYENLKRRLSNGPLEGQRLLVPEPVDLRSDEYSLAVSWRDLLLELGLEIEPFGGDTILVRSYPAILTRSQPGSLLRDVIGTLSETGRLPHRSDIVDRVLNMMACKAAIKTGDVLSADEISALLEQRHLADHSHHCPHGRPTALVFTQAELDRQFGRI